MENFKSPTIEPAGGPWNEIEPQLVHIYKFVHYYEHVWETQNVVVHHPPTVLLVEF
jgi:hypothetical protein